MVGHLVVVHAGHEASVCADHHEDVVGVLAGVDAHAGGVVVGEHFTYDDEVDAFTGEPVGDVGFDLFPVLAPVADLDAQGGVGGHCLVEGDEALDVVEDGVAV